MMNITLQDWIFYTAGSTLALAGITIIALALFKDRAKARRRCPKCWYDMTGVPGLQCPECGKEAKAEKNLLKTRRRWGRCATALFIVTIGTGLLLTPAIQRRGWPSIVPTPILNLAIDLAGEDARNAAYTKMRPVFSPQATPVSRWERLLVARASLDHIRDVFANDDNIIVSWRAFTLLGLGSEAKVVVPELIDLIESNHEHRARFALIQILAELSSDVHAATSGVIQILRIEPDAGIRVSIVQLLAMPRGASSSSPFKTSAPTHSPKVRRVLFDLARHDPATEVRIAAIGALKAGNTQKARIRRVLFDLARHDPAIEVRAAAIGALEAGNTRKEGQILAEIITDDMELTVRAAAADALIRMGPVAHEFSQEIIQSVREEFPQATLSTVVVLAKFGWPASGALGDLLSHEDLSIRRAAAGALDILGSDAAEATTKLINALSDDDESICYLCIKSLGHIGTQAQPGIAQIIEFIDCGHPRFVRLAAMDAVMSISPSDNRVIAAAIKLLADEDGTVRFTGIDALRHIGPAARGAIPTLEKMAQTETKGLRYNVMMALDAIRDKP